MNNLYLNYRIVLDPDEIYGSLEKIYKEGREVILWQKKMSGRSIISVLFKSVSRKNNEIIMIPNSEKGFKEISRLSEKTVYLHDANLEIVFKTAEENFYKIGGVIKINLPMELRVKEKRNIARFALTEKGKKVFCSFEKITETKISGKEIYSTILNISSKGLAMEVDTRLAKTLETGCKIHFYSIGKCDLLRPEVGYVRHNTELALANKKSTIGIVFQNELSREVIEKSQIEV